jgi:hypothetical protein
MIDVRALHIAFSLLSGRLVAQLSRRSGRKAALLLASIAFALIVFMGCRHIYQSYASDKLRDVLQLHRSLVYSRTVLATNYFDDAFVRRGLGGSIVRILGKNWIEGSALFIVISVVWLALPLSAIVKRLAETISIKVALFFLLILIVSPQTFLAWSLDFTRTDMMVAGFIVWSCVLMQTGKLYQASIVLVLGSLVHETSLIYGLPILAALALELRSRGTLDLSSMVLASIIVISGTAALLILQALFSGSPQTIARHMLSAAPKSAHPFFVNAQIMATYMQVTGPQGVKDAICLNAEEGGIYIFWSSMALITVLAYLIILPFYRRYLLFALAALVPCCFLLLVANDIGRWAQLSVLNAWLLSSTLTLWEEESPPADLRLIAGVVGVIGMLALGSGRYDRPFTLYRLRYVVAPVPYRVPYTKLMDRCVPGWRLAATAP